MNVVISLTPPARFIATQASSTYGVFNKPMCIYCTSQRNRLTAQLTKIVDKKIIHDSDPTKINDDTFGGLD